MKIIVLAVNALLLISFVYAQSSSKHRGFELYHTMYELPEGLLKFFYCEVGSLTDVRVEYKQQEITSNCNDYDEQKNELWKECTVSLPEGQRVDEGIESYKLITSGSLSVKINGVETHTICGYPVNTTTCLVTVFGKTEEFSNEVA